MLSADEGSQLSNASFPDSSTGCPQHSMSCDTRTVCFLWPLWEADPLLLAAWSTAPHTWPSFMGLKGAHLAGAHYVFDTAFSRNFSLLESQREFVQRFREQANSKQALPMLASACPGVLTLLTRSVGCGKWECWRGREEVLSAQNGLFGRSCSALRVTCSHFSSPKTVITWMLEIEWDVL